MNETDSYKIVCKQSPLPFKEVWRIESFLLKYFEYGNYSFRRSISGTYHKNLKCIYYLARENKKIIAAAGCLFSRKNPNSAILGPVIVEPVYRRRSIATVLCDQLINHLQKHGVMSVYLGVAKGNPARLFYRKLDFNIFTGIVMRKELYPDKNIRSDRSDRLSIKNLSWQHFPEVSALMCQPSSFYTFDYHLGIFSSRYEPISRFLPIFPEIMRRIEKSAGCAKVLKDESNAKIVGLVQIYQAQSSLQKHIAYLEFFATDRYFSDIVSVIAETVEEFRETGNFRILSCVSHRDKSKKQILENLGAIRISTLPDTILLNGRKHDVEVYQL